MNSTIAEIEARILKLSPEERDELTHRLMAIRDGVTGESPEEIAKAWDEEIARRVADMEAGKTEWFPAEEVMAELRAKIAAARANANQHQR